MATIATNLLKIAMAGLGIGLLIAAIVLLVQNWDKVKVVVDKVWNAIKDFGVNAWNVLSSFGDKVVGFVTKIINAYLSIPGEMVKIGVNIVKGLWDGMSNMLGWLQDKLTNSLVGKTISKVASLFGIHSPSTVFAGIGENLVKGLAKGVQDAQKFATQSMVNLADVTTGSYMPSLAYAGSSGTIAAPIQITINAGLGTDPVTLGREVNNALNKYGKVSNRVVRG
jgi:phage-related protein